MSRPIGVKNLAQALAITYAGPKAAHRLALDTGVCLSAAKMALRGQYPRAWERLLGMIAKQPHFLAHALKTTWAEELSCRAEIAATRRKLEEIERRMNAQAAIVDSKTAGDGGEGPAVGGAKGSAVKERK